MAFPYDNPQDDFFYGLMWPKNITEALITFLQSQKNVGSWFWNSNNGPAILEAQEYLNLTFNTDYSPIEVIGRVKKLRSRYNLFSHMITTFGVLWNREHNYVYASLNQWHEWRQVYPMSRAYMTQGEPLYDELKELFAPDDAIGEDELIIIIDSDDEDAPLHHQEVVQALPAINEAADVFNAEQVADAIVIISSDEDVNYLDDMFDSDVDLDFTDDEDHIPVVDISEPVSALSTEGVLTLVPYSDDEVVSPMLKVESVFSTDAIIRDSLLDIPRFYLRDEAISSSESE